MTAPSPTIGAPPSDLSAFPVLQPARSPRELFRIFHLRHRTTGALNSPWRFSSRPPGAARFDLEEPNGTCYWSDRRYGCWVEVWRGAGVVDRADVTRRALFTTTPPKLRLADTTARAAHGVGVTGELSTLVPYDVPQAWAQALHRDGFQGLVGLCRHDPSLTARNFAIFGPSGTVVRRRGWTISRSPLLGDAVLAAELTELGVQVAAVPHTVPITAPPTATL